MGKKNNRSRKNSGFAHTKKYPHENHPAHYRKKNNDDIEYLTFTHSEEVNLLNGEKVKTIPLNSNISPSERGKSVSHVFPKVFQGKRSALGRETTKYSVPPEDTDNIDTLFKELPKENVPITGGASKYRKRQNKKPRE